MVRPLCARWAYGSGTHAHAEHARQELMRLLSIRVKNWCVSWACVRVLMPDRAQSLQNMLSIRIRNWCACSACATEIKWCLVPPQIKVTSLYFSPKVTNPERLYGVKISVADPGPGSGAFLTPGSGIRDRFFPDPVSRIPDPKTIFLRAFWQFFW